jgi:predicted  nucleic acid-binding Zn-ribbon protein
MFGKEREENNLLREIERAKQSIMNTNVRNFRNNEKNFTNKLKALKRRGGKFKKEAEEALKTLKEFDKLDNTLTHIALSLPQMILYLPRTPDKEREISNLKKEIDKAEESVRTASDKGFRSEDFTGKLEEVRGKVEKIDEFAQEVEKAYNMMRKFDGLKVDLGSIGWKLSDITAKEQKEKSMKTVIAKEQEMKNLLDKINKTKESMKAATVEEINSNRGKFMDRFEGLRGEVEEFLGEVDEVWWWTMSQFFSNQNRLRQFKRS